MRYTVVLSTTDADALDEVFATDGRIPCSVFTAHPLRVFRAGQSTVRVFLTEDHLSYLLDRDAGWQDWAVEEDEVGALTMYAGGDAYPLSTLD
jgi:hypothetical protein